MATWYSSGIVVNPAVNQVLVDTGPLTAGTYIVQPVIAVGVASAVCELQHRNAANSANIKSQILSVPASGMAGFAVEHGIDLAANERLRIIMVVAITGSISASIYV